jgi:hypothetical protein
MKSKLCRSRGISVHIDEENANSAGRVKNRSFVETKSPLRETVGG